jgi:hypothetical protein
MVVIVGGLGGWLFVVVESGCECLSGCEDVLEADGEKEKGA